MMYRLLQYGNSQGTYSTKNEATALDRVKLAATFFIPAPGPKMIWQFGELGYDISIDQNGRVGKKPIKWEYLEDPDRQQLYRTFSELNYLKTTYDVFETQEFQMPGTGEIRTLKLSSADMNVVVVGNFGLSTQNASVTFQHPGWWYSYFSYDSLQSNSSALSISLKPGEFRFFFDKPIFYRGKSKPLGVDDSIFTRKIAIYPNPSQETLWISMPEHQLGTVYYKVMDAAGKPLFNGRWQGSATAEKQLNISGLSAGLYFLQIKQGDQIAVKRFIKR